MKKIQTFTVTTLGTAMMVGLTGCAATKNAEGDIQQTWSNSKSMYNGAEPRSTAAVLDTTRDKNANFARVQKNWVNPNPIPKDFINRKAESLPSFFQKKVAYTMPGSVTLVEIISEIKRTQKINVFLAQDIYSKNANIAQMVGAADDLKDIKDPTPLRVSDFVVNNLTLQEALDFLAAKANISWKWTGEEIEFYRYETKTYTINLLPGITKMSSSVNLSSESEATKASGGGSGNAGRMGATATNNSGNEQAGKASSTAKQGVTRDTTMDSWTDVAKYIRPLMSANGKLSIMESTGVINVTDTPDAQRKVAQAVKSLNNVLSKQIMLKVDIYSVTLSGNDDYGLDLNLAFTGSDRFGISFNSVSGSKGTSTGVLNFKNNNWQAGAVLKALSSVGQASIVNQFNVATLNGQPTPIGNNRKISYISGIDIQSDVNGNPMQSIETSAVYQGISMNITPKVLPNGKILIEYAMNMSDLLGFETLTTGGNPDTAQSLSLPNTTLNNILQRAAVKSGQAMVLSGFKQRVNSSTRKGSPTPTTPLLGGGVNAETKEQYLVVVVTPTVAQDNEE